MITCNAPEAPHAHSRLADMDAFDRLPVSLREILQHTDVPFSAADVGAVAARRGEAAAAHALLRHVRVVTRRQR